MKLDTPVICLCLLVTIFTTLTEAQIFGTMCTGRRFRRLSLKLQNEHQCLQMEQIQSEVLMEQTDRRKRHRELLDYLMLVDAKVDSLLNDLADSTDVWEEKWARKLKAARAQQLSENSESKMFAAAMTSSTSNEDDSGDSDGCGGNSRMCMANPFMANIDMKPIPHDCAEWKALGVKESGVYPVRLPGDKVVLASCDMITDDGGWTVIQRRLDGTVSFNRNWIQYREGFGNPNTEFWFGNEYLHQITSTKNYTLLINVWDWEGEDAYAYYEGFSIGSEQENYPLRIGRYYGNAGDSLSYQRNMNFSTPDRDNDKWFGSCARRDRAGWWFRDCGFATLNSQYHNLYNSVGRDSLRDGILWFHWHKDDSQSLQKVEIKIKPTAV